MKKLKNTSLKKILDLKNILNVINEKNNPLSKMVRD